jgi:hypothetical protein
VTGPEARVCPHCGEPPGEGVFCAACGRNLAGLERLPTRSEWEADAAGVDVGTFLAAMRAAGNPGTTQTPIEGRSGGFLRRAPQLEAWVVRPVERNEEDLKDGHYVPGLVLTPDGVFHRLDNKIRGWGGRDFPSYEHSVSDQPVAPPEDERLPRELAAVLTANGVATG